MVSEAPPWQKPDRVRCSAGERDVQALLHPLGVLGGREAVGLRVVGPGTGEEGLGHAPRSVRKK